MFILLVYLSRIKIGVNLQRWHSALSRAFSYSHDCIGYNKCKTIHAIDRYGECMNHSSCAEKYSSSFLPISKSLQVSLHRYYTSTNLELIWIVTSHHLMHLVWLESGQSYRHKAQDHSYLLLLLGLFPSSGVAGMVLNIILPLCPVQYILLL